MFVSPIGFSVDMVPPGVRVLVYLNPLTYLIERLSGSRSSACGRYPIWFDVAFLAVRWPARPSRERSSAECRQCSVTMNSVVARLGATDDGDRACGASSSDTGCIRSRCTGSSTCSGCVRRRPATIPSTRALKDVDLDDRPRREGGDHRPQRRGQVDAAQS